MTPPAVAAAGIPDTSLGSRRLISSLGELSPLENTLLTIRKTPYLQAYEHLVERWFGYLREKEGLTIRVVMSHDGKKENLDFEYSHRWKDHYKKMTLAKLYRLERAVQGQELPYTLLTLTTYQDGSYSREQTSGGYSIEESFVILRRCGIALMNQIKTKIRPGLQYLWVLEPHSSGYPHRHCIMQCEPFTAEEMKRIKNLWAKIYRAGSSKYGVNFSFHNSHESIASIRNYVMAYLVKSMQPANLTPGEAVYHAVAWRTKTRFWGASRGFSALMRREMVAAQGEWVRTEVLGREAVVEVHLGGEVHRINIGMGTRFCPGLIPPHVDLGIASAHRVKLENLKEKVRLTNRHFQRHITVPGGGIP